MAPWWRIAEEKDPVWGVTTADSSPREPTEAPRVSSSSSECNDFKDPKTELRFFCIDLRPGRGVSIVGVDEEDMAADQAATSAFAVPGRRRTLGPVDHRFGLWDRPKKPELRRDFLSFVKVSSEGVRSCIEGRKSGAEVVEDGLNIVKLFRRSFWPLLRSTMVKDSEGEIYSEGVDFRSK